MYIVYSTLILLNTHLAFSREWVDPHEMNINGLLNGIPKPSAAVHPDPVQFACPSVPINFSMSHYKRLINLLLSAVVDNQDDSFKGHLYINLPYESYEFLKTFAGESKDVEDSALLRKVDQILSKAFVRSRLERLAETLTSWADRIYFSIYNRTTLIYLSCLFVLFITYKLLRANLTIWSVVKYLLFLGWVTDFAFTWINLLQEAEINKMADSLIYETMPPYCNPSKMTVWQYLKYSLSSTSDCRKFHQTVYKDNFWSIAPVTVLSHQFGILIYTPASLIGQALGSFVSGLLGALPWGVNIILLPFLLIFSATILCIAISFLSRTSFRINFIHLLQLEFGNEQRRMVGDVLSGRNLNALLHMAHRNMVEDVTQNENSRTEMSASSNANEGNRNLMIGGQTSTSGSRSGTSAIENNDDVRLDSQDFKTCSKSGIPAISSDCLAKAAEENVNKQNCNAGSITNNDSEDNEKCEKAIVTSNSESKEVCDTVKPLNKETMHDGSGDKA